MKGSLSPSAVFAFEVSVKGTDPRWSSIINARTRGAAKAQYHQDVTESWPDIPFTALRVRKIGPPHTSAQFERNAIYRGLPGLKCGDRVKVGNGVGTIVAHNSSANVNVFFDEDSPRYPGLTLNVHPNSLMLI